MLGRGIAGLPRYPIRALRALPTTLPNLDVAASVLGIPGAGTMSRTLSRARRAITRQADGEVIERPRMRAPRVSFSGPVSRHRRFAFGSLSLPAVKRVKDHYGVKVNDVVVALSAGAVRAWLEDHDELPDRPLLAQIPVSVRTEEQTGTFGNRISVMIVPIPTDEPDPEDRVMRAHEQLLAAKERHRALPAQALQDVANFIPPAINARAARVTLQLSANKALRPLFNLVISNVPGPPVPIYIAGAKLLANYPISVITDGVGLNITVLSYLDNLDVGIVADREQMPDVDKLIDTMREDLAALDARVSAAST
jgi:WS/DGAT/MGAT family acyltransferase